MINVDRGHTMLDQAMCSTDKSPAFGWPARMHNPRLIQLIIDNGNT